jgi:hypothetical protein
VPVPSAGTWKKSGRRARPGPAKTPRARPPPTHASPARHQGASFPENAPVARAEHSQAILAPGSIPAELVEAPGRGALPTPPKRSSRPGTSFELANRPLGPTMDARQQQDDSFLRKWTIPEEDRAKYTTQPWADVYRWFRSPAPWPKANSQSDQRSVGPPGRPVLLWWLLGCQWGPGRAFSPALSSSVQR